MEVTNLPYRDEKKTSKKMRELFLKDNPTVGDFSGMKSSIKEDDAPILSNPFMLDGIKVA